MLQFPEEIIEMYRDVKPLSQRVYKILYDSLMSGHFSLNGAAFTESAVAQALGVSRTPVRAAFERLYADGILQNLQKNEEGGYGLTRKELMDAVYLDELLECQAAYLAAQKGVSANDLELLHELNEAMYEMDWASIRKNRLRAYAYRDLSMQFHLLIAKTSGSRYLYEKITQLRRMKRMYRSSEESEPHTVHFATEYRLQINQKLMAALAARDARTAEMLMRYKHYLDRPVYEDSVIDLFYWENYNK